MEGAEVYAVATESTASWEQLPSDIQCRILMLSAMPCVRRVCKAARDAYDAVNEKLIVRSARGIGMCHEGMREAAALRVVQRSPSLTAISLSHTDYITLADVASAAATGLTARLRKVTGRLSLPGVEKHMQALQECTGLVHLDMTCSQAWTMGEHLPREQHHREATALSAALRTMTNLTYLRVNRFCVELQAVAALVPALHGLTQLRHLDLAQNCAGPQGLGVLAPALSAMPGLQTLDVSCNIFRGVSGAEALCEVLRNTPALTHLNASDYNLGREGAAVLAPLLQSMTGLQHLHLRGNALGDAGVVALAPALAALPRLHTLNLASNELGQGAMAALQPVLTGEGSPLHSLDLSRNNLGVEGAQTLAAALCSASQLQSLNLLHAQLGAEGLAALAPAIGALGPSLDGLQICEHRSESDGAVAAVLAPTLQGLTGLTCLLLSCRLGPAGMALVAPALMGLRRLQVLDLSGNPMGPSGAAALAQVLPAFAGSLHCLDLSSCNLGTEGAEALAPALAHTTGTVNLHMSGNKLGPGSLAVLFPALRAMRSLRVVSFDDNVVDEEDALRVVRVLGGRDTLPTLRICWRVRSRAAWDELQTVQDVNIQI